MTTNYAKFTEVNDWEGETWHFWLPIEGNEDALDALHSVLDTDEYELDLTPVPEFEVDVLVKHTDTGYMAYHNKLAGTLTLTGDDLEKLEDTEGKVGFFYKGKISEYLRSEAPPAEDPGGGS